MGERNPRQPFAPPEDWYEPTEAAKYRIVVQPPGEGYRHGELVARGENLPPALVEAGINGDESIERATPRTLWLGLRLR